VFLGKNAQEAQKGNSPRGETPAVVGVWLAAPSTVPGSTRTLAGAFMERYGTTETETLPLSGPNSLWSRAPGGNCFYAGKTVSRISTLLPRIPSSAARRAALRAVGPVELERALEGMILWGSTAKPSASSREHAESVARGACVALGLEDLERNAGGERRTWESCGVTSRGRRTNLRPTRRSPHRGFLYDAGECGRPVRIPVIGPCRQDVNSVAIVYPSIPLAQRSDCGRGPSKSEPLAAVWHGHCKRGSKSEVNPDGLDAGSVVRIVAFPVESEAGSSGHSWRATESASHSRPGSSGVRGRSSASAWARKAERKKSPGLPAGGRAA